MKRNEDLISLTKDHIYEMYPRVIDIDIKVKRLSRKGFKSKIILRLKDEIFYAHKEDRDYKKVLERTYHAIIKQLEKIKRNKIHEPHSEVKFEDFIETKDAA